MRDASLHRAFVRFRNEGDGAALARVFDATARELLGVAAHLVSDPSAAEDLVQQTFVVAIERKDDFDPSRKLRPWLFGILARTAARAWRDGARCPDPGRLDARAPAEPWEEASSAEVPRAIEEALEKVPPHYREVLEPYLREDKAAETIARELGRAPGTVRSQIHRGLDCLRRALPSGMRPLHGAGWLGARGIDALREDVLAHALGRASAASSSAPGLGTTGGGPATASAESAVPTVLAATETGRTAVVLFAAAGFVALGIGALRVLGSEDGGGPGPHEEVFALGAADVDGTMPEAVGPGRSRGRTAAGSFRGRSSEGQRRQVEIPWHTFDGSPDVVGVVVDEDGAPVGGAAVRAVHGQRVDGPELWVQSDERGAFELGDLGAGYWFLSVDDPRFAPTWWREVFVRLRYRQAPERAKPHEVTIELHRPRRARGRVVDARGEPVAGARITLAVEHVAGRERPVQGHYTSVVQLVTSDGEGRFTLERVRPGTARLVLDHPAFARTLAVIDVPNEDAVVTMESGLTLEGAVRAGGEPLADAALVVTQTRRASLSMLPGGAERLVLRTDADGVFRVEQLHPFPRSLDIGVPAVTVAVEDPDWAGCVAVFQVEGRLGPAVVECVRREDDPEPDCAEIGRAPERELRHQGQAVGDGSLTVVVRGVPGLADVGLIATLSRQESADPGQVLRREELGEGRAHRFEALPPGRYTVHVATGSSSPPMNFPPATIDLGDREVARLEVAPGRARVTGSILGVDGHRSTGWISARPLDVPGWPGDGVARGSVGSGGFVIDGILAGRWLLEYQDESTQSHTREVVVGPTETRFDLELPAGRIEGRLVGIELPPRRRGSLGPVCVFPRGWGTIAGNRGTYLHPDEEGRFSAQHIEPGIYDVFVRARAGTVIQQVELTASSPVVHVELRHPRDPASIRGRIAGHVHEGGRLGETRYLAAWPRDPHGYSFGTGHWAEIDEDGTWAIEGLPPGEYGLMATGKDSAHAGIWVPGVRLAAGEEQVLTLEDRPGRLVVVRLDHGDGPARIGQWTVEMPDGTAVPYGVFTGSSPSGDRAPETPFALPYGRYPLEVDFGGVRARTTIHVEPGPGTLDVRVVRP